MNCYHSPLGGSAGTQAFGPVNCHLRVLRGSLVL